MVVLVLGLTLLAAGQTSAVASPELSPAERGFQFLTEKVYLPADFDQETFDALWQHWPEPLKAQAKDASPDERRRLAFSYYGLTHRPNDKSGKPLQYVVTEKGEWVMNCFACHGGKVAGQEIPGLPNTHFALQTLTEDVRLTKLATGKKLTHMDLGSLAMPLGRTNGTTNAVMFGVALLALREPDLTVKIPLTRPRMVHHDMDAIPWWHFKKKTGLYVDGFVPKGARPLMQFMLVKENGPKQFHEWETDYEDVYEYISSVEPPKYPFAVDRALAARGEKVFLTNCADCHGTYSDDAAKETYPNKLVSIEEVATDRVRLDSLSEEHRARYAQSWFAAKSEAKTDVDPGGYVAPPLDGIWASAPYFHNGSVPTLWHVLHAEQRPKVWKRSENGYDRERVGLEVEEFEKVPSEVRSGRETRTYFDTSGFGKSAQGHTFPEALSEEERGELLEYLKTL